MACPRFVCSSTISLLIGRHHSIVEKLLGACRYLHHLGGRSRLGGCNTCHLSKLLNGACPSATRYSATFPEVAVSSAPKSFQPYLRLLRLDKPIGTWLLYWPCTWSIALAAPPGCLPDIWLLALFGAGAILMRGSGCVVNDLFDRDFDRLVERTKNRPLASGMLQPIHALFLLAGTLSFSLAILLQLNWYSVIVGSASMALVVTYPLAKRFTYWPQAYLGLTFNYGVLLGWCAVRGSLDWPTILPLYVAGICWTIVYDTIYAHQDKEDDLVVGVKSTALLFGEHTKPWLVGFSTAMLSALLLTGLYTSQPWSYFACPVAVTGAHLAWQVITVNLNKPSDCWSKFRSNHYLGAFVFAGIVLANLLGSSSEDEKESDLTQAVIMTKAQ